MPHAILGAGGIGGFIGAALARSGQEVVLLMRPSTLARYDGRLAVESAVLGDFAVQVPAVSQLEQECDILWVTTKAMALGSALAELGPPDELVTVAVIPLLNGVDHMAALATTALDATLGAVRDDGRYLGCQEEALAVADAVGARVDVEGLRALQQTVPDTMRSSMQKDVAAGREPELDAIAGPILRGGERHGISVPHTEELSRLVAARSAQTQPAT